MEANNECVTSFKMVVSELIKKNGLRKVDLATGMGITYETLRKYLVRPQTMTGEARIRMAEVLNISVEAVDNLCNGNLETFINQD